MWVRHELRLSPMPRGIHIITRDVVAAIPEIHDIAVGLLHVHICHTSASLALNENASPDMRRDLRQWFDHAVPDDTAFFRHTQEGPDDMPSHVKSVLTGSSLTLPVGDGHLEVGTWQGIYLCEHRDHGGSRRLVLTLWGQPRAS